MLARLLLSTVMLSATVASASYYNYEELSSFLETVSNRFPSITRKFSIGTSVAGRQIWCLEISDQVGTSEILEPEVKLVANIHGDEAVGRMLLIYFIDYLCSHYGSSTEDGLRATRIVDGSRLFVIPSLNPDGYENSRRENALGVDLNRDFPDQFIDDDDRRPGRQRETQAMMRFTANHSFVLGASFHGGALVANYAYDANRERISGRYSASPDDEAHREIALTYARSHASMRTSSEFEDGITNGAAWYVLYGGMQDWNYLWHGCMSVTLEVSDVKRPPQSQLLSYWDDNRESMLSYAEIALRMGVRGLILDRSTLAPIAGARIVVGDGLPSKSHPITGAYFKLVAKGTHNATAVAPGYSSLTRVAEVNGGTYLRLDFALVKN